MPTARVYGIYKPKARKVRPVDQPDPTGVAPGGIMDWERTIEERLPAKPYSGNYAKWLIPKFSDIKKGSRLTPERAERMKIGHGLTEQEKDLLLEVFYNREAALAWDFSHLGKIRAEVAPPQEIRTIPHEAWQAPGFKVPRALVLTVVDMLKERLAHGILEYGQGPYRNQWFLVKKKNGKYRLVNAAMPMNKVTIRDANMPPSADEFSENFAGCQIASLIDFFSGYDQVELDIRSRDMTAFMTPLGLLRQTTLPQGATNSVAQFVRIVTKILQDHIPDICLPFLDDIGVKGPTTTYDDFEDAPGIRKYIQMHIQ